MKNVEMLEITRKGNISLKEENIKRIMYMILVNKISNVRYFLKNELNIEPTNFYEKLRLVEKEEPKFYKYYVDRLEKNQNIMKENIKNMLFYIDTFMQYGVEVEDGTFREFDLFDLYSLKNRFFDNLNRKELSLILDEATRERTFYIKSDIYSVRKLLSMSFSDNPGYYSRAMHRDEILSSEERGLSLEEAQRLLYYMEKNKVPLNYDNYILGCEKIKKERETKNDLFKLDLDTLSINNNNSEELKSLFDIMIFIINNKIINIRQFVEKDLKSNYSNFKRKLDGFSKKYPEIYDMYKHDYEENFIEFKEQAKEVMLYIAMLKGYGIELEDGTFRRFDLFDFYNLKNKYLGNLNKKDLIPIFEETFKDKELNLSNLNIDELRFLISSTTGSRMCTYDALDIPISDQTILKIEDDDLDLEEKQFVIKFMRDNNIPFTLGNYTFGAKKMINQRFTSNDMFGLDIFMPVKRIRNLK